MKRLFFAAAFAAAMMATSCTSIHKTATVEDVNNNVASYTVADLNVSPTKIVFNYKPNASERRGGGKNAVNCAVAEALKANGNADVLVGAQYVIKKRKGNVKEVTVTGYPATYKNFRKPECKK